MRILQSLVVIAALALPGGVRAETLADALIAAYRNSNLLEQNRALLRAADEDVAVSVSALRPVISFTLQSLYRNVEVKGTGTGSNFTTDSLENTAALNAEISVLDFGRNRLAIDAAKETVLATREALVDVEQAVLFSAVRAFVDVRLAQSIVDVRQSNVRLVMQELRAAQDRFEVGEVTRTDVAIAQSRLATSRAELAAAEGDLAVARESYKLAVGNYPGTLAPPPATPKIPATLSEARDVAVRTHPALRRLQHEVKVADLNVARAGAATKPEVIGRATVDTDDNGLQSQTLSLTMTQTLYAGGQLAAFYRRAIASRAASRSNLLQITIAVEQNVGAVWSNLNVAVATLVATGQQIEAARTAFEGFREEAKLGARTTLDVLDSEQELLNAQVSRLSAEATRYLGVYAVLQSMGLLTVDHLKLGIPTYDPAAYYNAVKNAPAHSVQSQKLDRILKTVGGN